MVAYIADSLTDKIKKKDIAKYVAEGKLLLISDLKPNVGFSAGRAMNRNKFIYASAIGTFVVESDYNKGRTRRPSSAAAAMRTASQKCWALTPMPSHIPRMPSA